MIAAVISSLLWNF